LLGSPVIDENFASVVFACQNEARYAPDLRRFGFGRQPVSLAENLMFAVYGRVRGTFAGSMSAVFALLIGSELTGAHSAEERFEVTCPPRTHIGGECRLAILGCVPSEQILHKIGDRDPVDLRRHKFVAARFLNASAKLCTRFGLHRGLC